MLGRGADHDVNTVNTKDSSARTKLYEEPLYLSESIIFYATLPRSVRC